MHVYVDLYVTDLPMSSQIGVDPEEGREKEREGGGEREKQRDKVRWGYFDRWVIATNYTLSAHFLNTKGGS